MDYKYAGLAGEKTGLRRVIHRWQILRLEEAQVEELALYT